MSNSISIKGVAVVLLVVFLLVCGQSIYAQDGQRADCFMQKFDQNQDGTVSRDEYPGPDDAFTRLDGDKDGAITATEVQNSLKRRGKGGGNFIARFDDDKDGKVSKEEFPRSEDLFTRLDANNDGYITADEAPAGRGKGGRRPRGRSFN